MNESNAKKKDEDTDLVTEANPGGDPPTDEDPTDAADAFIADVSQLLKKKGVSVSEKDADELFERSLRPHLGKLSTRRNSTHQQYMRTKLRSRQSFTATSSTANHALRDETKKLKRYARGVKGDVEEVLADEIEKMEWNYKPPNHIPPWEMQGVKIFRSEKLIKYANTVMEHEVQGKGFDGTGLTQRDLFKSLQEACPNVGIGVIGGFNRDAVQGKEGKDLDMCFVTDEAGIRDMGLHAKAQGWEYAHLSARREKQAKQMSKDSDRSIEDCINEVKDPRYIHIGSTKDKRDVEGKSPLNPYTKDTDCGQGDFSMNDLVYFVKEEILVDWTGTGVDDAQHFLLRIPFWPFLEHAKPEHGRQWQLDQWKQREPGPGWTMCRWLKFRDRGYSPADEETRLFIARFCLDLLKKKETTVMLLQALDQSLSSKPELVDRWLQKLKQDVFGAGIHSHEKEMAAGEEVTVWQQEQQEITCTITKTLGKGGQGYAYEITSKLFADSRALKISSFDAAQNEALIFLKLNFPKSHQNVVKVNFVYTPPVRDNDSMSKLLCMMELVRGPKEGVSDLAQAIRDGVLYEGGDAVVKPRLMSLTLQLAFAIEYMHSQGIVHKDIKPANILLDAVSAAPADASTIFAHLWRLVLMDFGVSSSGRIVDGGKVVDADLKGCTPEYCSARVHAAFTGKDNERQHQLQWRCTHTADLWCFLSTVLEMYAASKGDKAWRKGKPLRMVDSFDELDLTNHERLMPDGLLGVLRKLFDDCRANQPSYTGRQLVDELLALQFDGAGFAAELVLPTSRPLEEKGIDATKIAIMYDRVAAALYLRGKWDDALDVYSSALKVLSLADNVQLLNNSAVVLQRLGSKAEAKKRYKRVLELAPENAAANNNLARLTVSKSGDSVGVLDTTGMGSAFDRHGEVSFDKVVRYVPEQRLSMGVGVQQVVRYDEIKEEEHDELVLQEYTLISEQHGWIRLRVFDLDSGTTSWRYGTMSGIRLDSGEVRCSNYVAQQVAARVIEFAGFVIEAAELCAEQAKKIAAAEDEVAALVERTKGKHGVAVLQTEKQTETQTKKLKERVKDARRKVNECLVTKEQQPILTDKVIMCHWDNEKVEEIAQGEVRLEIDGTSTTVSVERIEPAPSVRYIEQQRIVLFHENAWHFASVLSNTDIGSRCRVRIDAGDWTQEQETTVDLNDANHAPAFFVSMAVADQAKQRYTIKLKEDHGHIYDIFSGQQLSTRTQTATLQYRAKQMLTGEQQDLDDLKYQKARKESQQEKTEDEQKGVLVSEILKVMLQLSSKRSSGHWVVKHNRMLILGPAASGKTTLLKTFIVEILYSYPDFLPILIPIIELVRVFEKQQPGTSVLTTYLQQHYADHCHLLMQKVMQRQVVFLIDGIDESGSSRAHVEDFVTAELLQPGHKTIITSRHSGFAGDAFQECKVVELLPLTPSQQGQMVKSRVDDVERAEQLIEQLVDPVLAEIASNPLMLTMVISIYVSNNYKLISNRAELYEQALQTIVARTDKVRAGVQRSEHEKIFGWLQQIAFNSHLREGERRIFTRAQAMEWAGAGFETVQAYIKKGKLPIVTSMGLNSNDEEEYRFSHLTYQEYLTARELVDRARNSHFDLRTITDILGSPPTAAFADVRWQVSLQMAADRFEQTTTLAAGEAEDTGLRCFARTLFGGLMCTQVPAGKLLCKQAELRSMALSTVVSCDPLVLGSGVGMPGAKALAKFLSKSENMRSVYLQGAQMAKQGYADILEALVHSSADSLRELDLSGEADVTDEVMERVTKFRQLRRLLLADCTELTDRGLENSGNCSALEHIDLSRCVLLTDVKELTKCTQLRQLVLAGCAELTDEGLSSISQCSVLEEADIAGCHKLTDSGMQHLAGCEKLTKVNVERCEFVSTIGLMMLCKACEGLRLSEGLRVDPSQNNDNLLLTYAVTCPAKMQAGVNLAGSDVTDTSLRRLSLCKELQSLDLRGCAHVTGPGVAALMKACDKLVLFESLQVERAMHVTDEVVIALAEMRPDMETLDLRGCAKVTDECVTALEEACEKLVRFQTLQVDRAQSVVDDVAKEEAVELAAIPYEATQWDSIEGVREREAHGLVKDALLNKESYARQCVVAHGLGGTGKTVCAVAMVKDTEIREHFSKILWVSIGQDALIEDLQDLMMKQIADKGIPNTEETKGKLPEQQRLEHLKDAATSIEGHLLVVLDDPWSPEQVQYLNPLDARSPSKLLLTTRKTDLVEDSLLVPLELLKVKESLLMEIGQVEKDMHLALKSGVRGRDFPPSAALSIANECGNLPLTVRLAGARKRAHTNSTKAFSDTLGGEERIIIASLNSIRGEDA
eukprot:g1142.t1